MKPTFPAAARAHTDAGAVAFVEYYWAALNYAMTYPDKAILKDLSTKSCDTCIMFQATADGLASERKRFDGPLARIESLTLVFNNFSGTRVMSRLLMLNAYKVDSAGHRSEPQGTGEILRAVNLEWISGWRVIGIGSL